MHGLIQLYFIGTVHHRSIEIGCFKTFYARLIVDWRCFSEKARRIHDDVQIYVYMRSRLHTTTYTQPWIYGCSLSALYHHGMFVLRKSKTCVRLYHRAGVTDEPEAHSSKLSDEAWQAHEDSYRWRKLTKNKTVHYMGHHPPTTRAEDVCVFF